VLTFNGYYFEMKKILLIATCLLPTLCAATSIKKYYLLKMMPKCHQTYFDFSHLYSPKEWAAMGDNFSQVVASHCQGLTLDKEHQKALQEQLSKSDEPLIWMH